MNKRELILSCAEKTRDYQKVAEMYVDAVLGAITEALISGEVVSIKGFGRFEVRDGVERVGRNPRRPEETYTVPSRKKVKFKAGARLKRALNKQDVNEEILP